VILPRTGGETSAAAKIILETVGRAFAKHSPSLKKLCQRYRVPRLREATFIKDQDITDRFLESLSRYQQQEGFEFPPDYVGPSLQTPHRDASDSSFAIPCVVALEENTFLRVWPRTHMLLLSPIEFSVDKYEDIRIPKGKMLVFNSTLYHAGLGNGNMRLHFQYDDMKSDAQSTYFNNKVGEAYWKWVKTLSEPQARASQLDFVDATHLKDAYHWSDGVSIRRPHDVRVPQQFRVRSCCRLAHWHTL